MKGARPAVVAALLAAAVATAQETQPDLGPGFPVFPADNPWNWDITGHAVHPSSAAYIATIGGSLPIERGSFRYDVVTAAQSDVNVTFDLYPDESDPGPGFGSPAGGAAAGSYPIPGTARIEFGGGDTHVLVVDRDARLLYETYLTSGPPWTAANGAVFDLASNALRPDTWTSGDAAGLPIFPGLLRYEEVARGAVTHALRFTTPRTRNTHLNPARHHAGQADTNYPPMGIRLRLKAGYDLSGFTGAARVVLEALKKHGVILSDNGNNFISATFDSRWDATNVNEVRNVPITEFEAVLTVDAGGNPIPPSAAAAPAGNGGGGGGSCGLLGAEAALLALFLRRGSRRACSG